MKVKLNEIKSASKRVRQSWDVDKLQELTDSIKEQGVLVPVKLRPNGDKYDIVFGHRRVAAAREAGLKEIEAIVEGLDDDTTYIQALTENLVREDMKPLEIAEALKAIKDGTGLTNEELARLFGWKSRYTVEEHLNMLKYKSVNAGSTRITPTLVKKVKDSVGAKDEKGVVEVLTKAVDEELTIAQAHDLGKEYTRAKTAYGSRGAKQVLSKPWLTQQPTTTTLEAEATRIIKVGRGVKTEKAEGGEVHFSWVRDERVVAAEQALKDISKLVSDMNRSKEDREGAVQMIKSLRKLAQNVVDQMDNILGG